MYLLSLRLAPSPWVGIRVSGTAQYTVPSVSTQIVTPRRVGFLACACAPARAEPAGPSVWCTMMLRQGWVFETSPHGVSQTIFRPAISGVPDARAAIASSGVCADAGLTIAMTQSAVTSRREVIVSCAYSNRKTGTHFCGIRAWIARSRVLAQRLFRHRLVPGRQRRRRGVNRAAVLAIVLGGVDLGGRRVHKKIQGGAERPAPLSNADRNRDRDLRADACLGVAAAHFHDAAGHAPALSA